MSLEAVLVELLSVIFQPASWLCETLLCIVSPFIYLITKNFGNILFPPILLLCRRIHTVFSATNLQKEMPTSLYLDKKRDPVGSL